MQEPSIPKTAQFGSQMSRENVAAGAVQTAASYLPPAGPANGAAPAYSGAVRIAQWLRIPAGPREKKQWLLAAPNKKGELKVPMSVGFSGKLQPGSSTDSATWLDHAYACDVAIELNWGIGFVVDVSDEYGVLDFDVKNANNAPNDPDTWTPPERIDVYKGMVEEFASYTELSQSGQGVHVWVRGKIGKGIKRAGIELYSQERFIVCTGLVVKDLPIEDRHDLLNDYAATMRAAEAAADAGFVDEPQRHSDNEVLRRAWHARNCAAFQRLWLYGERWQEMGYPSQSEADQVLIERLCFHSSNDEQVRRLFRLSPLGKRDKATKNDRYLDRSISYARRLHARKSALFFSQVRYFDPTQGAQQGGAR